MLWACLHFPALPLHAVFDTDERTLPCALTAGPRQRPQIAFSNAHARKLGVHRAQPLAAARACCAMLRARARDEAAENRLLRSLAAWAYRFSSQVSLDGDALLIEVGASLRLFGGWQRLLQRLRAELAAIGHAPRIAVAPVARAARVLAMCNDDFLVSERGPMLAALGSMPLADSGLSADAIALLCNVGLRTLSDVFALPRPELARRIGPAGLILLDRMRGDARETLLPYRPPDRFDHRIEFEARIEAWPPLLFPLRRLCEELSLFLAARDGGVQRCELVLEHESRVPTRVAIELLTPQRDARMLHELIRSRLERATIAAAVSGMALIAHDLPTLRPQHADLFETKRAQSLAWPDLTERLRSRLGDEAVRRLAQAADHRPENAWRFETDGAAERRAKAADTAPAAGALPLRPLWLLRRALPLVRGSHRILAGPERIESGWWDDDVRRDYYVLRLDGGQHAWAFRTRGAEDDWMLHGWFA
jgi:protein ImuB